MHSRKSRIVAAIAACAITAFGLAGCASNSGSGSSTLTLMDANTDAAVALDKVVIKNFEHKYPNIKVDLSSYPSADADNFVRTRLSTGTMSDVLLYNSGSLFQALAPSKNFADLSNETWVAKVNDSFKQVASFDGKLYGAPAGPVSGGGIFYNKKVYAQLGLSVPKTWNQFISNSVKIKAAGKTAVIETFGDSWSAQLLVLGDFANVAAANPKWADKFTANKAKIAGDSAASAGFDHLAQVNKLALANDDYATAKFDEGLRLLTSGQGVQYPMLTQAAGPSLKSNYAAQIDDIGFFAIPGAKAASNPLTTWVPGGAYINKSAKSMDAAKKFVAFLASKAGCDSVTEADGVTGPYLVNGCTLPADKPQYVADMLTYIDRKNGSSAALEFLSPVKGPSLPQITVAVGSGITSAADGAAQYDQDVKKQAEQLSLAGW